MFLLTRPPGARPCARSRARLLLLALEERTAPAIGVGLRFAGGSNPPPPDSFTPPDTDGSIGPNHYVQFINGRFAVYNKTNGTLAQTPKTDVEFWSAAGISSDLLFNTSDTRMYYDPLCDRWFAVELGIPQTGSDEVLVGRSDSNNPTGTWHAAHYVGNSGFADYPTLGVDANAVYIGTLNFNTGNSITITSIPKADLLLATPSVANRTTREQSNFGMGFILQGVTNWAPSPAHGSIVAVHETNFTQVKRTTITGTGGRNATFGPTVAMNVLTTAVPGTARQPDLSQAIDGLDDRIGSTVWQVGDLIYLVHGISVDSNGNASSPSAGTTDAVRLTVIRDSTTQVVAEATWFNTNFDYIMPSVAANSFGDIVIGYTRSSFNTGSGATDGRLGAYAVNARINPANPGLGITFGSEVQLKAGQANNYHLFNTNPLRWGDYSATGQDPNNPLAFWTTQEYAIGPSTWGTWISQVFISPRAGNVTSTAANGTYGGGAVIPITVTFNNPVTVTGSPQIALNSGGTAVYASGSGTDTLTFNYTVASGQASTDLDYTSASALTLNGGTIKDAFAPSSLDAELTLADPGTPGSLGANKNIVIDASVPRVANVTSSAANGTYFAAASVPIVISFGVPVVVTGTPRLALNSGATVDYTSGSGTPDLTFTYTVGAGQTSPDLDYTSTTALTLNGGTIKDQVTSADAVLTLTPPESPGSLGANKDIVVDGTAPKVTNVSSTTADGTYTLDDQVVVTVQFNKVVAVTGSPQITLNAGAGAVALFTGGGGTTTLTFTYTVGPRQDSPDLDYSSAGALTLNGGTITEVSSGQNANLALAAPGTAGSLGANKNIVIVTPPGVTNVASAVPDDTYRVGANIPITVSFSRPVTVTGSPQLALNSGGTAVFTSGSGTNTLTFTYLVAPGEDSPHLDYVSTTALSLNGGTIVDSANANIADLTLPAPGAAGSLGANTNLVIDTHVFVTGVTSTVANGIYVIDANIPITVTFNAAVLVTGSPVLALNSGATVVYTSGNGTNVLTFDYIVATGEGSSDLDYTSTSALALNGGTITDQVTGEDAVITLPAPGAAGSLGANKNIVIDTQGPEVLEYRVLFGTRSYNLLGSTRFDLPWLVKGIQVVFTEPVVTGSLNSLSGLTATGVTGLKTRKLTFRFPAVSKGSFTTALADSGAFALRDKAGNPIAAFGDAFKVLYGDFNDDGVVDAADEAGIRGNIAGPYQLTNTGYNVFADLSGDGIVNLIDVGIARTRKGQTLP